jgi:hypothetical protein
LRSTAAEDTASRFVVLAVALMPNVVGLIGV